MDITLKQEEIATALVDYISGQGINLDNKDVDVSLIAGRGTNGHTATISVTPSTDPAAPKRTSAVKEDPAAIPGQEEMFGNAGAAAEAEAVKDAVPEKTDAEINEEAKANNAAKAAAAKKAPAKKKPKKVSKKKNLNALGLDDLDPAAEDAPEPEAPTEEEEIALDSADLNQEAPEPASTEVPAGTASLFG